MIDFIAGILLTLIFLYGSFVLPYTKRYNAIKNISIFIALIASFIILILI